MIPEERLASDGFAVLAAEPATLRWADAARQQAKRVLADPEEQARWLRHGATWFVGVDALPNGPDGAIGGVALAERLRALTGWAGPWHRAQLSAVYPGYPARDAEEGQAAHRYRMTRDGAHLDGLHAEGAGRRRHLREPHAFILGLPLNAAAPGASPLVVWEGSHHLIGRALAARLEGVPPDRLADEDLTESYIDARAEVFARCPRRELPLLPGQAVLLHRHAIHGIAPWRAGAWVQGQARMTAYFRPVLDDAARWLGDASWSSAGIKIG